MCGHLNQLPDVLSPGGMTRRHGGPAPVDPEILADQQAAIEAGKAQALFQRKRMASTLFAGTRGLLGAKSALGAVASSGGGGGSTLSSAGGGYAPGSGPTGGAGGGR